MLELKDQFKDLKSFEVVFLNKNKQLQKILCDIKSIQSDRIILDANNLKNKGVKASVGDEFRLHIYTENGVYYATSRILLVTPSVLSTEYIIAYPTNSKHCQRREFFRADLSVDFEINILFDNQPIKNSTLSAQTRNICGKGMSFYSKSLFPEHDSLNLMLVFEDKTIYTQATLVYSMLQSDGVTFIHAFMFDDIMQDDIDFIVKKCFLHQLELKKRN